MGCVASKLEEEEEVVSICRERKRLLKLAVERRYLLAESHCRYCQSLYAVGAAIRLFVARHSSPSSPFLITFPPPCPPSPPPENGTTNPKFLHQAPSEQTQEAMPCDSCGSSTSSGSDSSEECQEDLLHTHRQEHEQEQSCGYYFMPMAMPMGPPVVPPPPMASPQRDFGWDFFFPYDGMMRPEVMGGYMRSLDEDLRAVREQEGIPELEEAGDREEEHGKVMAAEENGNVGVESHGAEMVKPVDGGDVSQGEQKGLSAMGSPEKGRELLEALKDIEDYFTRAFDSGKDVSKMLEANRVHLQSGLKEIKENSTKLIQAITWHRSASSKATSCKSLVASSSKSSSTWSEDKSDLFDDYGGMASGSHSLTLGRLYAWEKKLYEEVKAGDSTRKLYEKKCSRLQNQGVRGDNELTVDKTRVSVKDLYARILVAIRSAESISKRIQKLRDEELEPQIVELLKGLARTWKIMLESHETQNKILNEVKSFACPSYGKFCNDSHRLATLQLEAELQNWQECFADYISSQRSYVEALNGWLTKFLIPEVEFYPRGKRSAVPYKVNGPPLLVICHDWLAAMDKLPEKAVTYSLKSFSKDVRALWAQQGDEKQQKRKVEGLAKELERRVLAFQKAENRFLDLQVTDSNPESDIEHSNDYVTDKKDQLDMFRRRLEMEKEKHHDHVRETQRVTLNGFQTGFCAVFESLTEFSKASLKMYNDLVTFSENAEKLSFVEGSEEKEGSR